jgi:hypothetical protein
MLFKVYQASEDHKNCPLALSNIGQQEITTYVLFLTQDFKKNPSPIF